MDSFTNHRTSRQSGCHHCPVSFHFHSGLHFPVICTLHILPSHPHSGKAGMEGSTCLAGLSPTPRKNMLETSCQFQPQWALLRFHSGGTEMEPCSHLPPAPPLLPSVPIPYLFLHLGWLQRNDLPGTIFPPPILTISLLTCQLSPWWDSGLCIHIFLCL